MTHKIANAKIVHKKASTHQVTQTSPLTYRVVSGTSGKPYYVALSPNHSGATCSCDWGQYRPYMDPRSGCSHTQSVVRFIEESRDRSTAAWNDQDQAARQHRPIINLGDGVVITSRKEGI
jgi:hypothetical protein